MNKHIQIAIDGPSGVGKSTLAKAIAKKLGIVYVDTGAIYRTVGLYAQENDINPKDEATIKQHFCNMDISLKWTDDGQVVLLNGRDVSKEIRTPRSSMYASDVSALPSVREFLLEKQRSIANASSVVMDGRDIGTVILPNADVKIFMSASEESRAKRRYKELLEKGEKVSYEEVLSDISKRDNNDSTRKTAPLRAAEDAVMLDNTDLSIEETINAALKIISEKVSI